MRTLHQVIIAVIFAVASGWSTAEAAEYQAPRRYKIGDQAPKATILYLHGLGGDPGKSGVLKRVMKGLERRGESYDVVAPCLRREGVDSGEQPMTYQVEQAIRAMKDIKGPVIVVGHSMGGLLGLYCQKLPELENRVQATVCFAPSVCMLKASWKWMTGNRELPEPTAQNLEQMRKTYDRALAGAKKPEDRAYLTTMRDMVGWEPRMSSIPRTTAPTLVVYGDQDEAVSPHYLDRLADKVANPGVTAAKLPGVDHGIEVSRIVESWGTKKRIVDEAATEAVTSRVCSMMSEFMNRHLAARP
jgi:pimeloyl-ACP methyl ester carboxylesterase